MGKFNERISSGRFRIIAWTVVILAVAIVCKAAYVMTAERDYWTKVSERLISTNVKVKPTRGNILGADGQLLAASLPEYLLFIDFKTMHESKADTLWEEKEDSICIGLNQIYPQKSVEEFRKHLREGKEKQSRYWRLFGNKRVSYSIFCEVKALPIFNLNKNKGGFSFEPFNARTRPNGSLAARSIGEMYGAMDSAKCGLELTYDSVLRGETGLINRRKVLNKYIDVMVKEPVDGADIVTTLDVNIQDIAEHAMLKELREVGGDLGVVVVMETKTGDVKALVNLTRLVNDKGVILRDAKGMPIYREVKNNAVSDLVEPGSVFKTASILAALEDGIIDTTRQYNVATGNGVVNMYGRDMRDHNWRRGGYGTLTVPEVLYMSSNIGVSKLVDRGEYKQHPEKFVERIHKMGLGIDLDLPFVGAQKHAIIRMPKRAKNGQFTNWAKTTLPWMSIGYETQVPPIFMVSFYNAIANDGRFMQPRFVKEVRKDGKVLQKFEPVCLIPSICSEKNLRKIQHMLEGVVSQGLGKKAGSKSFRVAGKTGTAQVADQSGSYKSGTVRYWLSFCGYFPYDNPQYTCIVCLKKTGLPASGGGMCGVVFHEIAEGIMAKQLKHEVQVARDSASVLIPEVKPGNLLAADYVLKMLRINANGGWNGSYATGNPVWGVVQTDRKTATLQKKPVASDDKVPDVHGMGARDAVYLLESRGIKVTLHGRGKVTKQSIGPNMKIEKGMHIILELA